jgi:hypothetical protein
LEKVKGGKKAYIAIDIGHLIELNILLGQGWRPAEGNDKERKIKA